MTIHREGYKTIAFSVLLFCILNVASFYFISYSVPLISWLLFLLTAFILLLVIYFFRIPTRKFVLMEDAILAPADGKVVAVEEVEADEFLKGRRIQVSIFMSPLNVHVNRNPVSGEVLYSQYHPGKYLVAWHPKSSLENERHTVVFRTGGREVLVKQIAGALARRICNYVQPGMQVKQADEMGFIKFGSRVDLLLPTNAKVQVKTGDRPKGGLTVIAHW